MTHVLLIGDRDVHGEELGKLLDPSSCRVTHALNRDEALDGLHREPPDVVLIDLDSAGSEGLPIIKAVHKASPSLPVILMSAMTTDRAAEVLREGGTAYIRKHNAAREIARTIENVLVVARLLSEKKTVLESLNGVEFSFVLGNDIADISPLLASLEQVASILHPCDPTERMRVNMALNEALLNAIQHGNLEMSSELRQDDEKVFRDLGNERKSLAPYNIRRTFLRATLSRSEAVYVIEDEGNGFDFAKVVDAADEENLLRIGGRGLLLIRAFMDEVQHNEKGNRVELRKSYSTAACSAT